MDPLCTSRLTPEETTSLLSALQTATPFERELLEEQIVAGNLYLADRISRHYASRGLDLEDLRQVAGLALLKALRRFDADRGSFVAYASVSIAGEIKRYFRDHGWMIRPPRSIQELHIEIGQVTQEQLQGDSHEVTLENLAERLDVPAQRIREARSASRCFSPESIDGPLPGPDRGRTMADTLGSEEPLYGFVDNWCALPAAWHKLTCEQRELLELRFYRDLTQERIAAILGISQMQVSRRLKAVLAVLREELSSSQAA